ncbi:MAG: threonylcarbamoyl-AMP synthase [Muribaculaceae bacterium]|nr:threonylcarbamoyl-AMP synthase [Muribaculaceae bacterium]
MTREEDIANALKTLRQGGVILYPTAPVWGIGCDATRSEAVKRIYDIKHRADSKAMIVLLSRADDLWNYVEDVPDVAFELIEAAVRPLTIVYDRGRMIAPELLASDGSIGIRVTSEEISSRLCRGLRRPLVSTSANISGEPSPALFCEITPEILKSVDYVMESRRDDMERSKPSSVIKLSNNGIFKILRP